MQQLLFSIAHFIPMYLTMALVGAIVGTVIASRRRKAERFSTPKRDVLPIIVLAIAGGVLGAKSFQIIGRIIQFGSEPWFWTAENWLNMMPGIGVLYGGLFGGIGAALLYIKIRKLDKKEIFDLLTPSLAIFFAFGRIGCFFAGCCHGFVASWGIALRGGIPLAPVQLFESAFHFAIAAALIISRLERKHKGILMPIYLMAYAVGRFGLEFFRGDMNRGAVFGVSTSQWISLALFPVGAFMLWYVLRGSDAKKIYAPAKKLTKRALAVAMSVALVFTSSSFAAATEDYEINEPAYIETFVDCCVSCTPAYIAQSQLEDSAVLVRERVLVQEIRLVRDTLSILEGDTINLSQAVTVYPLNATNQSWMVSVDIPEVLQYESGRITGLAPGEATVTFTALDASGVTATMGVVVREMGLVGALAANDSGCGAALDACAAIIEIACNPCSVCRPNPCSGDCGGGETTTTRTTATTPTRQTTTTTRPPATTQPPASGTLVRIPAGRMVFMRQLTPFNWTHDMTQAEQTLMRDAGCFACSIAMTLDAINARTTVGNHLPNPQRVARLSQANGNLSTAFTSIAMYAARVASRFRVNTTTTTHQRIYLSGDANERKNAIRARVDLSISNSNIAPPIVRLSHGGTHFVLVIGYWVNAQNNVTDFLLYDPGRTASNTRMTDAQTSRFNGWLSMTRMDLFAIN